MNKALIATVALVVGVHALFIGFPSVNSEFAFEDAARYFVTNERILIDEYFSVQANPVTLPLLTAGLSRILPGVSPLALIRLLGLVGLILLSVGMYRICGAIGRQDSHYVIPFLLLNPLVWIYSGRATVDFLPVAVGVFAIAIVLRNDLCVRRALLGGVIFGVAVILKYHAVMLLLPVAALYLTGHITMPRLLPAVSFGLPIAMMLGGYLLKVHEQFGFWITPPEFQTKHQLGFAGWLSNFICYAGYLTLLTLPTMVLLPELRAFVCRRWRVFVPVLLLLFAAGFYWIADNGEMNLGPLDRWVPEAFRTSVFALISVGIFLPLLAACIENWSSGRATMALWGACLAIILVFSLTRPAQRYLLFVLPFFVLTLPPQVFANRRFYVTALALFGLGNGFVEYSRWCTGSAANDMAEQIQSRGLLAVTDPGAIQPHAGGVFYRTPRTHLLYTVVAGNVPGAITVTQAGSSALTKYYSLIEAPGPQGE